MRLSKFIASSGYASRRKSDSLIENGFVIVNNEVCRDFSTQVLEGDEVIVENTKISLPKPKIYSFYKPKNYYVHPKIQKAEEQYMMFSTKIIKI